MKQRKNQPQEKQGLINDELVAEVKSFWLHENWAFKQKKLKHYAGGSQTIRNTALQRDILRHLHILSILEIYFLKLVTCTSKSTIASFKKPARSFYFSTRIVVRIVAQEYRNLWVQILLFAVVFIFKYLLKLMFYLLKFSLVLILLNVFNVQSKFCLSIRTIIFNPISIVFFY